MQRVGPPPSRTREGGNAGHPTFDINDDVRLEATCIFGAGGKEGAHDELVQPLLVRVPLRLTYSARVSEKRHGKK